MNSEEPEGFDDKEWSSLLDDWQSQPTREIDARALLKKIKRRSWVIWLTSMLDLVVILFSGVGSIWMWLSPDSNKDIALLLMMMCLWGMVMMYFEVKLRQGTWKLSDQGNESILDFSLRRCEVAISIARFFTPAFFSCLAVITVWQSVVYYILSGKLYGAFLLTSIGWFALVVVASRFYIKHKQKELEKLKAYYQ